MAGELAYTEMDSDDRQAARRLGSVRSSRSLTLPSLDTHICIEYSCRLKHASLLKKRIRKGIPEALRGRVWCHLAASTQMAMHNPGVYRELLQTIDIPCEDSIARDIGRTFPKHYLFHAKNSLGQGALMNVLKAYSLHDPDVGYCQGMAFLSAMFLSYIPEEQSFWHLVACLNHKRYDLANIYRPGMPKVGELVFVFERLMALYIPRVAVHLREEGLHPTTYLSQVSRFCKEIPRTTHEGFLVVHYAVHVQLPVQLCHARVGYLLAGRMEDHLSCRTGAHQNISE